MHFAFTDEQEQLREAARGFLAAHAGSESVRRAMQTERGFDPELWKRICGELGWPAILVPEAYGGLGLGWIEMVALLEVTGSALLCAPLFSTLCLGTPALLHAGSEAQRARWLAALADGSATATLAFQDDAHEVRPGAAQRLPSPASPGPARSLSPATGSPASGVLVTTARSVSDGYVLRGRKRWVLDGATADVLVVVARDEADGATALFLVPGESEGLVRRTTPTLDATRRFAEIELRDVRLPAQARMPGGADALATTLDLATIALAAEQTGGAQRCLDLAVAHAKTRIQFGRPIGSFQAIQHACADLLLLVESARSASYYAACVANEGADDLAAAASLAKAYCSDAYFRCAADCLQIHGGVGFTWEYDVHLHLKRAKAGEHFLGSPSWHRERIAQHMGL